MEQTTLLDMEEITIESKQAFFMAVTHGEIDDMNLVWTIKRSYEAHQMYGVVIPVDQLTMIPAWKKITKPSLHAMIEASPYHNLYVKLYDGQVVNAATHVNELLTCHEITNLYNFWKN